MPCSYDRRSGQESKNLQYLIHGAGEAAVDGGEAPQALLGAGIVEKIPELNEQGRLSVRYEIQPVAYRLRDDMKES